MMRSTISGWLHKLNFSSAESIAVIIPVYNVTTFLEETIVSVVSQKYPRKEIIVVNDGSDEKSAVEIVRICSLFSEVILLHQKHAGAAVARASGMRHATAGLIMYLDADDILFPGALRYFADVLRKNPEAVAAYAMTEYINGLGKNIGTRSVQKTSGRALLLNLLARQAGISNGSICMRRQVLEKIQPDNSGLRYGEDWVMWCYLALAGNIIYAGNRIVLGYRRHTDSIASSFSLYHTEIHQAFDKVYNHPAFIEALGQDVLNQAREKALSLYHLDLAHYYSKNSNPEKAQYHLEQVKMSPTSLFDNRLVD